MMLKMNLPVMDKASLLATASYYSRLVSWLVCVIWALNGVQAIPQQTVSALRAIILFVILLSLLIYLRSRQLWLYEHLRWFATPAIVFLKSWTSLFFFVYLVDLPSQLSQVSAAQIVSWICQCLIGNLIALSIPVGLCTLALKFVKLPEATAEHEPPERERSSTITIAVAEGEKSINVAKSQVEGLFLDYLMQAERNFSTDEYSQSRISTVAPLKVSASTRQSRASTLRDTSVPPTRLSEAVIDFKLSMHSRKVDVGGVALKPLSKQSPEVIDQANRLTTHSISGITKSPLSSVPEDREASVVEEEASAHETSPTSVALPFVPTMDHLMWVWLRILMLTAFFAFLMSKKTTSAVIAFQIAASVTIFIAASAYRNFIINPFHWTIQVALQSPVLFTVPAIFITILSANDRLLAWQTSLDNYLVTGSSIFDINEFGAGNFIGIFLDPAIVTLAFTAVEPILTYWDFMYVLIPLIITSCVLIYIFAALLSLALQSPSIIALPLICHSITTPIALAIAELISANQGITAATAVINGVLGLRLDSHVLDYMQVKEPLTRGVAAGVAGTLLGVVALDERNETLAAGLGMAGYGIATVVFALLMAITPFQEFIVDLA